MTNEDNHKKLVKLGADVLATALLDLTRYSDDADAVVERLLAGPKERAKSFKKRLSSLKRQRSFISWGESRSFAGELLDMLHSLEISEADPKSGVESVAAFYEADAQIFDRCDDSSGYVGDVFKGDAANLFASFASRCEDKQWILDLVISLNREDHYGVRDELFKKMSLYLPELLMREAVNHLWQLSSEAQSQDRFENYHWFYAIEVLAKQLKDPQLLEKTLRAQSSGDLSIAAVIDIAKLYYECKDLKSALAWVKLAPSNRSIMVSERDDLLIAIYREQGNSKELTKTAERVFERSRSVDSLEVLLDAVGAEKRDGIMEAETNKILKSIKFDAADAIFLVETGRIDDADRYIVLHAAKIDGNYYTQLLELAKTMLKHDRLLAASVLYRALIDSILARAKSKIYHHAINYLEKIDRLALKISDWKDVDPHLLYHANLRVKHKYKSSFWSQYDSPE